MITYQSTAAILLALSIAAIPLTAASPAMADATSSIYPACTGDPGDGPCEVLNDSEPFPDGFLVFSFPNDVSSFDAVADVAERSAGRPSSYHLLGEDDSSQRFLFIYASQGTATTSTFPRYPTCPDGAATSENPPCQALYNGRPLPDGSVVFTFPYRASSLTALADIASHMQGRPATYTEIGEGGPWHRYVAIFAPPPAGPCGHGQLRRLNSGDWACVWLEQNGSTCIAYQPSGVKPGRPEARSGRMIIVCYAPGAEIPDLDDYDPEPDLE